MSQVSTIRETHAKGNTVSEIARALSIDRKTVYRYIKQEDFSPKPPVVSSHPSKLDPYKEMIEGWLEEDKHCFHKQRHTIRHISERLAEEHDFYCPYGTVADYIRKNIRKKKKRGSNHSSHCALFPRRCIGNPRALLRSADGLEQGTDAPGCCTFLVVLIGLRHTGLDQMLCVCAQVHFTMAFGITRVPFIMFDYKSVLAVS